MEIRDKEAKESLIEYINEHPKERLWQAIRNWCGFPFVWIGGNPDKSDAIDTFHLESELGHDKRV